jgi:hypothetical protein
LTPISGELGKASMCSAFGGLKTPTTRRKRNATQGF